MRRNGVVVLVSFVVVGAFVACAEEATSPSTPVGATSVFDSGAPEPEAPGEAGGTENEGGATHDGGGPAPVDAGRDAPFDAALDTGGQTCAGLCAPATPAGWTATQFYAGAGAPPACADAPIFDAFDQLVAPPATCSSCAIAKTPLAPGFCAGDVLGFAAAACGGASTMINAPMAPACSGFTNAYQTIKPNSVTLLGNGTCAAPPPQNPVVEPVTWGARARGCTPAAAAGTCAAAGAICLAQPAAPFAAKACVSQDGDAACPVGFGDRHVEYKSYADTRDCSACASSYTGTCSVHVVGNVAGCAAAGDFLLQVCTAAGPPVQTQLAESCAGTGGASMGAATASDAVTVCCAP